MSAPAHKNVTNPPGQIVNHDLTLADYIERKKGDDVPPKKKLSFEEYWRTFLGGEFDFRDGGFSIEEAADLWQAAQENK